MGKRGRPAGVDSAETRQRILDAARTVFSVKGYDGASVLKIAESADLAPSAIYNHYESLIKYKLKEASLEIIGWHLKIS